LGGSRFHGDAAGDAVKVDPMLPVNDLKALRKHFNPRVPKKFIHLRKLGYAGLSAIGAPESFDPVVAGHPS
jgi:hypothetical protein